MTLVPRNVIGGLAGGIGRGVLRGLTPQSISPFEAARLGLNLGRAAAQLGLGAAGAGLALGGARLLSNLPGRETRAGEYQQNLTFPADLLSGEAGKYYMSLRFVKYVKRAISDRKTIDSKGVISLPIPNNLTENTQVEYNTTSLGTFVGAMTEAASGGLSSVANPLIDGLAAVGVERAVGALGQAIAPLAGQGAGDRLMSSVSALSGLAINPFLTVVFKNPKFKKHTFSWTLIPRSEAESQQIKQIIDTIKYHMLPGLLTSSGVIFEYPEMVLIKLHPNDEYTYKFKPCVVESFDVNYAPAGAPSFYFSTSAPTAVEIKISVQEIEYFTKLDYLDPSTLSSNIISGIAQAGIDGAAGLLSGVQGLNPESITPALREALNLAPSLGAVPFAFNLLSRVVGQ